MEINQIVLLGYALFLAVMLTINFLYFFQIYRYRLPGDASVGIMVIHIILLLTIVMSTSIYILSVN